MIHCSRRMRWGSDARGATAIEMALIAPLLFLFLLGIIEVGILFFTQSVIESATSVSSRTGKTGFSVGGDREKTIRAELAARAGLFLDVSKIKINTSVHKNWDEIPALDLGNPDEIVVYRVSYPWHFFTPMLGSLMGGENGVMMLTARTVVKNEPSIEDRNIDRGDNNGGGNNGGNNPGRKPGGSNGGGGTSPPSE